MSGRVGVLAPMTSELAAVRRAFRLQPGRVGDGDGWVGRAGDTEVLGLLCGVGPQRAAEAARRLLDAGVEHVVVSGVAGGLDPRVRIGDLVVPEVVVDHASGRELRASRLGTAVPDGRMVTTDGLLTPEDLAPYRERGCLAVDMENSGAAAACEERGVPWTAFRSVSDQVGDVAVTQDTFAMLRPDGTTDPRAVVRHFARHPGAMRHMARMGRQLQLATRTAAVAAAQAVRLR